MTEKSVSEDQVIVPLEEGDSFETDTPPNKRFEPKKCLECLTSPGKHNTKNLEQEIKTANLRSRIIEDILLNRVPAGVTIRCLSNGQTVPTLGTSIVSSTSTVSSGSARKALFSPFLRRYPFLRFCIVCSCLCLCLMLVALLAFRNGAFYLKRLACHFIIVWVRKLLRGTVFLIHRLSIYTVSLTVGWLLFGLSCWVTRLLGVIRFALLAFI